MNYVVIVVALALFIACKETDKVADVAPPVVLESSVSSGPPMPNVTLPVPEIKPLPADLKCDCKCPEKKTIKKGK